MKGIIKDKQTAKPTGELVQSLIHGVTFKEATTFVDDRGSVCEIYDSRWTWHPDPLVFTYMFTVRPGVIKGWGDA